MTEMTDDERDQLLSDVLDGVGTEEQVALVRGDPELSAQLESWQAMRARLQQPPSAPPPSVRDEMLQRALAELQPAPVGATETQTAGDGEDSLARRRTHRARRQRRLNVLAAAAAVVIVVGGAAAVIRSGSNDGLSDSDSAQEVAVHDESAATDDSADGDEATEEQSIAAAAERLSPLDQDDSDMAADSDAEGGGLSQDAVENSLNGEDATAGDDTASEDDATDSTEPSESEAAPSPPWQLPPELESCTAELTVLFPDAAGVDVVESDTERAVLEITQLGTPPQLVDVDIDTCDIVPRPGPGTSGGG